MRFKSLLGAVRGWLARTRCKYLLVITLLCLVLRENYPFSHFPMFSSFSSRTYYIYLADAQGTALKGREFGLSNSDLKKIFDRFRREELERFAESGAARVPLAEAAAGQSLLRYLDGLSSGRPRAQKLLPGLQVQHVQVHQEEGDVRLETSTVVRHR
jgi:hypothetical protein